MSRVPEWWEPHGWHKFKGGNIAGKVWCEVCDNVEMEHLPADVWIDSMLNRGFIVTAKEKR